MLGSLFEALNALGAGVSWKVLQDRERYPFACDLGHRFPAYLRTFKAWKSVDEKRVAKAIKEALCNLTRSSPDAKKIEMIQIGTQKSRMLLKLEKIAGREEVSKYLEWEQNGFPDEEREEGRGDTEEAGSEMAATLRGVSEEALGMRNEQLVHELLLDSGFMIGFKKEVSTYLLN